MTYKYRPSLCQTHSLFFVQDTFTVLRFNTRTNFIWVQFSTPTEFILLAVIVNQCERECLSVNVMSRVYPTSGLGSSRVSSIFYMWRYVCHLSDFCFSWHLIPGRSTVCEALRSKPEPETSGWNTVVYFRNKKQLHSRLSMLLQCFPKAFEAGPIWSKSLNIHARICLFVSLLRLNYSVLQCL